MCIALLGCVRREHSIARVSLPEDPAVQTQLMAYVQSPAFATDVEARLPEELRPRVDFAAQQPGNSRLLELRASAGNPQSSADAANLMVTVLKEFAMGHELGEVDLVDPAVPSR